MKRSNLKVHIETLEDIYDILTALKNLSLVEINKISKFINAQEKMKDTLAVVGHDFLASFPEYSEQLGVAKPELYILIGSERGFCSGFNENVVNEFKGHDDNTKKIFVVGNKLSSGLTKNQNQFEQTPGLNCIEELSSVISELLTHLTALNIHASRWRIIFNTENSTGKMTKTLRPFYEFESSKSKPHSFPPILNQSKDEFLLEFSDQYLLSLLYYVFCNSFLAENYQRLRHLDNALEKIKKEVNDLKQRLNTLRQEEITQEIEIIMLSSQMIIEELTAR